jgi:hypothetical protein
MHSEIWKRGKIFQNVCSTAVRPTWRPNDLTLDHTLLRVERGYRGRIKSGVAIL